MRCKLKVWVVFGNRVKFGDRRAELLSREEGRRSSSATGSSVRGRMTSSVAASPGSFPRKIEPVLLTDLTMLTKAYRYIEPCISNGRTGPVEAGHPEPVEGCTGHGSTSSPRPDRVSI